MYCMCPIRVVVLVFKPLLDSEVYGLQRQNFILTEETSIEVAALLRIVSVKLFCLPDTSSVLQRLLAIDKKIFCGPLILPNL